MDHLMHLKEMMQHRINQLKKQAARLSRMAGASTNSSHRRSLRHESRVLKHRAKLLESRLEKLAETKEAETKWQINTSRHPLMMETM